MENTQQYHYIWSNSLDLYVEFTENDSASLRCPACNTGFAVSTYGMVTHEGNAFFECECGNENTVKISPLFDFNAEMVV